MTDSLRGKLATHNAASGDESTKIEVTRDGHVIVVVCTPLMKRVHAMWQFSKEMVFVDSSGSMDRQKCRVLLFLSHSQRSAPWCSDHIKRDRDDSSHSLLSPQNHSTAWDIFQEHKYSSQTTVHH